MVSVSFSLLNTTMRISLNIHNLIFIPISLKTQILTFGALRIEQNFRSLFCAAVLIRWSPFDNSHILKIDSANQLWRQILKDPLLLQKNEKCYSVSCYLNKHICTFYVFSKENNFLDVFENAMFGFEDSL